MKRFASLFLAAVLGSASTMVAFQWLGNDNNQGVKLEYVNGAPVSKAAYHVREDGKAAPLDFTQTAELVTPAVVFIKSTQDNRRSQQSEGVDPFREFFGPRMMPQGPSQSSGSGVLVNENGYIVTNNHVVQDADVVEVTLQDNRMYKAEVVGTDPDTDIALIKINEKGLPHLSFVNSDNAKVGEWVLAVGNPFNLNSTVTAGIISAKGRSINILQRSQGEGGGNTAIESFIQTDAAINPGNSGGALVDLNGGLLGINTAIASPTGSYSGYGFAVPANIVSKIVEDLIQFGSVQRGWLGLFTRSVDSQLAREQDLSVNAGAYISNFPESSAAKEAGLKEGDVVVKIDQAIISSSTALVEQIGRHRPGDKVNITVNRKGKEITIPVILKKGKANVVTSVERDGFASLGLELEEVSGNVLKKLDINNGVRVKALGTGKLSKYTDIREGFIITKVNEVAVKSVKEFNELLKKKKAGELVILSGTYEDLPREFNYAFRM